MTQKFALQQLILLKKLLEWDFSAKIAPYLQVESANFDLKRIVGPKTCMKSMWVFVQNYTFQTFDLQNNVESTLFSLLFCLVY